MKYVIYLCLALLTHGLTAQNLKGFSSARLVPGSPPEAKMPMKDYGFSDFTQTSLETGVDTFQVTVGSFMVDNTKDYYTVFHLGKQFTFRTIKINNTDASELKSDTLTIQLSQYLSVSLRIRHDSGTDQIRYQWIDRGAGIKKANIVDAGLIHPDKPMPDFAFYDLENKKGSLSDFKGKYVVINWWNTGCGPCIMEMPILNNMVEKYKSRDDIIFLAVAWNDKEELNQFLPKRSFNYLQTYNKDLIKLFGNSFPRHFIVNPEGVVTDFLIGGADNTTKHLEIEDAVRRQLEGK
jgi:thiol-disulfide isomerase/thioredoxin